MPDVDACYFSITVLLEKGGMITFKDKSFTISIGNTDLVIGYMECRLFWFDASIDLSSALHAHVMVAPTDIQIWHHRMGHLSYQALKRYQDSIKGMTFDSLIDHDHSSPCAGCEFGKQAQPPFHASSKRLDWQLQIVHSDVMTLLFRLFAWTIRFLLLISPFIFRVRY